MPIFSQIANLIAQIMTQFVFFFQVSLQYSALQFSTVGARAVLEITRIHRRSHTGMRMKDVAAIPTRLEL